MALCLGAALLVGAAVLHLKIIRTHIAAWPRDWSPGVPEHAATLPRGGVPGETWAGLAARKKLVLLGAMRRQQAGATAAAGAAQAAADAAAPRGGTGRGAAGAGRAAPWPPYGAARPLEEYEALAARGPHPIRLKYPMIWCSAFWSRSGGCATPMQPRAQCTRCMGRPCIGGAEGRAHCMGWPARPPGQ